MRILIVDDDEPFRLALRNAFVRRGYDVALAASPVEAETAMRDAEPQYAVVDLRMPGGSGLDVVRALRGMPRPAQVVVLTGYGTIGTAVEAIRLGAINYLNKPADADEIEAALQGKRPPPMADVPSLDRQEWEYLNRILADCNGNISEAARRLKMHRRTLQRKLQKHPPKV
ncbi:MAG TPA: response regulator [Myxococcales bacterium]|jgi:two-component system response regulator RegA|nr:response regulator [Myxococcales bacterium]